MKDDLFKGCGVEIRLAEDDDFLKVKETLTRMGISSPPGKDKKLYQSCHILHKQGRYAIVHFKELFALDGKPSNFSEEDKARRNRIIQLIADWGLITLVDENDIKEPLAPLSFVKIIQYKDKDDWELVSKYSIGKRK